MLSEAISRKVQHFGTEIISDIQLNCNKRIINCVDRPNFIIINSDESEVLIGNEACVYFSECESIEISSNVMNIKLINGDILISLEIPRLLADKAEAFVRNFNNLLEANQSVEEINLARASSKPRLAE